MIARIPNYVLTTFAIVAVIGEMSSSVDAAEFHSKLSDVDGSMHSDVAQPSVSAADS